MKLVKASVFALLTFMFSANASVPATHSLLEQCLSFKSTLVNVFAGGEYSYENKVSFQYQNSGIGFKGVRSNAPFFIEKGALKKTEPSQCYAFVCSSTYNAESSELSLDNIQFSSKQPKNIQILLQEKI